MRPRSPFGHHSTAEQVTEGLDLTGKMALITGSNSGIGLETARVLALRGAHVVALARTQQKAEAACAALTAAGIRGQLTPRACELTDYDSLVGCARAVEALKAPLDILICNAGLNVPTLEQVNGIEKHFAVHHLSHFILVNRLLHRVKAAPQGRIVIVSSMMYQQAPPLGIDFDNLSGDRAPYEWTTMYGQSKLANGLFARELARRLAGTKATANVLHPGIVPGTNINHVWRGSGAAPWKSRGALAQWLWSRLWHARHPGEREKTLPQGAATSCYVATHPSLESVSGAYFRNCHIATPRRSMRDDEMAARLWGVSEALTRPYLS
jgi:NAD(P)-dependent dehydrogenase (short-subunit alcohol dehydrogenase family)